MDKPVNTEQMVLWIAGALAMVPEGEGLSPEQLKVIRDNLEPIVARLTAEKLLMEEEKKHASYIEQLELDLKRMQNDLHRKTAQANRAFGYYVDPLTPALTAGTVLVTGKRP
jgi:hypothetical protein